jgi:cytidylate kinase
MIVTIDGPAGSGKSSASRKLAARLGFEFLDTGAMYRAVTLAGLRTGCDFSDEQAVARLLADFRLEMAAGRVTVNGEDVTAAIRTAEVTAASRLAANAPAVRRHLNILQRAYAQGKDIVTEGRDQGTIVFPDAACKFFLTADETERARRRVEEMNARGEAVTLEQVLEAQRERDRRDAARDIAPMKPAADAVTLDTTGLSLEQVVERMEREVRRCQAGSPTAGTRPPPPPP